MSACKNMFVCVMVCENARKSVYVSVCVYGVWSVYVSVCESVFVNV